MKKLTLFLLLAVLCGMNAGVMAQSDSAWLDAGVLKIRKDFTQTISIRGEDLEKMPFTNLSDAISAWLYGAYSNRAVLTYVVDGNLWSDVNTLSVYDIEEVVYVQNAVVLLNSAASQQQLVLIRTRKKGGGANGITVAVQPGLVNQKFQSGYKGSTNAYQQYYIGIHRDNKKISYGLSGSYQQDAIPSLKVDMLKVLRPDKLDRWRVNGYFTFRPDLHNEITLGANYGVQQIDSTQQLLYPDVIKQSDVHFSQHVISPWASWHSTFGSRWTNDLRVGYIGAVQKEKDALIDSATQPGQPPTATLSYYSNGLNGDHYYARERLSYTAQAGGWGIVPSLNASYEHWKGGQQLYSVSGTRQEIINGAGSTYSVGVSNDSYKYSLYILTPSLDIAYKRAFDFQGGVLYNLSHLPQGQSTRGFPFASVTLDLLKFNDPDNRSSLQVFGSYAKRTGFTVNDYGLGDLSTINSINLQWPGSPGYPGGIVFFRPGYTYLPGLDSMLNVSYWVWETGVRLSVLNDRLQVNYNFEKRNYTNVMLVPLPAGGIIEYYYAYPNMRSFAHYINLMVKILDGKGLHWQSGLSMAALKTTYPVGPDVITFKPTGDMNSTNLSWTGGWVNQLRYHDLTLGVNLLYHFNEEGFNATLPTPTSGAKTNAILLQNIYAGYLLHLAKERSLEVYLTSRGLLSNKYSDLIDHKRYYCLGGKLGI